MEDNSFLHEAQKSGKATGTIEIDDIDQAILDINKILVKDVVINLKSKKEQDLDTSILSAYCQDWHKIVTIGIKEIGKRRKKRIQKICGVCNGIKLAFGREDALKSYYHIEEKS